ncbi:MAG: DNA topoisomerase IB [Acidobacteriota bacterium]|nr:DNA topoisomerase IB [Acidobacteriota bacterium]
MIPITDPATRKSRTGNPPSNRRARRKRLMLPTDPVASAAVAGLRYISKTGAGITRRKVGSGFCFLGLDGKPIRDKEELRRIRSLVIPPAWSNVWICPSPQGHLQATGTDVKMRRQYRYHPLYRQIRNHTKFSRMIDFGKVLPSIRERVQNDLALSGLQRQKVLATVVRLLETTFIRIGNVEYARDNSSFGLTTLRNRHVAVEGSSMTFTFRGKSGQDHEITIEDRRLARIVKACQDLPGHELFQYKDDAGERHVVDSSDVNAYLHEITGEEFTAKDFRTWAGTVQTALALTAKPFESETEAKRNIVEAVKSTARLLGNRPATCRNYYVHPAILESYMEGSLHQILKPTGEEASLSDGGLQPDEVSVLAVIRKKEAALVEALPLNTVSAA